MPGCWHHVTQRGNRQQTVFFSDVDREMYLRLLAQHCRRGGVAIAGYCLMAASDSGGQDCGVSGFR